MALSRVRSIVSLIILVVIITFVLTSTSPTKVKFAFFGNEALLSASIVIFLALVVGFILGYLFRITRFFRKKAPKKTDQ